MPVLINLQTLIDEQKCYETVRQIRWTEGVSCSKCGSKSVVKRGFDETQPHRQRYQCQTGGDLYLIRLGSNWETVLIEFIPELSPARWG